MVFEAVKVALDPAPSQKRRLLSHAGSAGFAYNAGLARVRAALDAGEVLDWCFFALVNWWGSCKDELAVGGDGEPWWQENSKGAYSSALESPAKALSSWSKSRRGGRKGGKVGFPKCTVKGRSVPRFACATGGFGLVEGGPKALKLPRIGGVHCVENVAARVGDAKVERMTVSQRAGRWRASLAVEREDKPVKRAPEGGAVGVVLGVKALAALSGGAVIESPRYLREAERKLKQAQQALSRKTEGSNGRSKAKAAVARIHARVANQRLDAMRRLAARLARKCSEISVEGLHVAGRVKSHHLAKPISDAAFGEFRRQLEYKAARGGAALHVVGRWRRSGKTCSGCGGVKVKLSLNERTCKCDNCGLTMGRDLDAAINICVAGGAPETLNAHGGTVRRSRPSGRVALDPTRREPGVRESAVRLGAGGRKAVLQTAVM